MKHLMRLVIALLTIGWVIPLWLGIAWLFKALQVENDPQQLAQNSFPFSHSAHLALRVFAIWIGGATFCWLTAWVLRREIR